MSYCRYQDNSEIDYSASQRLALATQLKQALTTPYSKSTALFSTVTSYRTYKERIVHSGATTTKIHEENKLLDLDAALQAYFTHLKTIRGNDGNLSYQTVTHTHGGLRNFFYYIDQPITDHTLNDLVQFKKGSPNSTILEQALRAFSVEQPIKSHTGQASLILGIFRANFAPLSLRINNHYDPAEENCTEGIFFDIYSHLDKESQDMIQWNMYVPERAKASYCVPFDDLDLTRKDYAIIWIKKHRSKSRVKHPCFVPIDFAKHIIDSAKASGRQCPFPNHESRWRKITTIAKQEYKVRLVSNYCRKLFESRATKTSIRPAIAAFIMGDKTKLNRELHLPAFYLPDLRFIEELVKEFNLLAPALDLDKGVFQKEQNQNQTQQPELLELLNQLLKENLALKQELQNYRAPEQ